MFRNPEARAACEVSRLRSRSNSENRRIAGTLPTLPRRYPVCDLSGQGPRNPLEFGRLFRRSVCRTGIAQYPDKIVPKQVFMLSSVLIGPKTYANRFGSSPCQWRSELFLAPPSSV